MQEERNPEDQLTELAHIFAQAILRLHRRAALCETSPESAAEPLDVLSCIGLTVTPR
jgi:hypothetical protein